MWPPSEAVAELGMSLGRMPLSEHLTGMVRQEHGEQRPQQEQEQPWPVMSLAQTQRRT